MTLSCFNCCPIVSHKCDCSEIPINAYKPYLCCCDFYSTLNRLSDYLDVDVTICYTRDAENIKIEMFEEESHIFFIEYFTMQELWDFGINFVNYNQNKTIVNWSIVRLRVAYRFWNIILDSQNEIDIQLANEIRSIFA